MAEKSVSHGFCSLLVVDVQLDEIFGKVGTQSEVNLKKMKRRNRDMKKGDTVVVTRGSYGGCTGEVKMTLPKQGKVR